MYASEMIGSTTRPSPLKEFTTFDS